MSNRHFYRLGAFAFTSLLVMLSPIRLVIDAAVDFARVCLRDVRPDVLFRAVQSIKLAAFKVIDRLTPEYEASYRTHGHSIDINARC